MYKNYEHWVDIEEDDRLQISDWGNVRHSKTKRLYKTFLNHGTHPYFRVKRNGCEKKYSLARLVYKYFGDGNIPTDRRVYILHKDNDKKNNRIDNLFLATTGTKTVEEWQIKKLEDEALTEIRKVIKFKFQKDLKGRFRYGRAIDETELEQGAMIECFRNLHKLVDGEPLFNFCYKYVKFVYYKLKKESREKNRIAIYEI